VYAIEAMLLVDWQVAHHLIKSSNVAGDESTDNLGAICDSTVDA